MYIFLYESEIYEDYNTKNNDIDFVQQKQHKEKTKERYQLESSREPFSFFDLKIK